MCVCFGVLRSCSQLGIFSSSSEGSAIMNPVMVEVRLQPGRSFTSPHQVLLSISGTDTFVSMATLLCPFTRPPNSSLTCLFRALSGTAGSLWLFLLSYQTDNRRKEAIRTAAGRQAVCESRDGKGPGISTSNPSVLKPQENQLLVWRRCCLFLCSTFFLQGEMCVCVCAQACV